MYNFDARIKEMDSGGCSSGALTQMDGYYFIEEEDGPQVHVLFG